jgi:hypothetical protein
MIVKDEAASIRAVLEAALPHVDRVTIVDTGSTDGTQKIAREACGAAGVPFLFAEEPFVDFATSRNRALALDRAGVSLDERTMSSPATFQLVLSGDEYLAGGDELRAELVGYVDKRVDADGNEDPDGKTVDLFWIRVNVHGVTLMRPLVFRAGSAWRYEGVVHETPVNRSDDKAPMANITGALVDHVMSDPERRYQNICDVHVPLLKKQLDENPTDAHALKYLAQSYEGLMQGFDDDERKEYAAESLSLRLRWKALGVGTPAERAYNEMHMIDVARMTGLFDSRELLAWAKRLRDVDRARPETAMLVATLAMSVEPAQKVYEYAAAAAALAEKARAIPNQAPVDASIEWRAHNMAATACKQLAAKHGGQWFELMLQHARAGMAVCEALGHGQVKHVFYPFLAEEAPNEQA